MTGFSNRQLSSLIPCAWLADGCIGKNCLFWHARSKELPRLNRLEGLAVVQATAALAVETRENAASDPALRTLLATSEATILRSLLERLSTKQVVPLLVDWGREQPPAQATLTKLARVWGVARRGHDYGILLGGIHVEAGETADLLKRMEKWSAMDLAFLNQPALRQVVAMLPDRHLLLLIQCGPPAVQRRLVEILDDDRLTRLASLPESLSLTSDDQEELFLTLESAMAVLAEGSEMTESQPGGGAVGAESVCPLVRGSCRGEACLFWSRALPLFGWQDAAGFCAIQRVNRFLYDLEQENDSHRTDIIARWLMGEERLRAALLFAALPESTQESVVFWCLTSLLDEYHTRDAGREAFFRMVTGMAREIHFKAVVAGRQDSSAQGTHEERAGALIHERLFDLVVNLPRSRRDAILAAVARQDKKVRKLVPSSAWCSFNDLADLNDRDLQRLIRELAHDTLLLAFKAASERVRKKFYDNLSEASVELLQEDFMLMGPVREEDALEAQRKILVILMKIQRQNPLKKIGQWVTGSFSGHG